MAGVSLADIGDLLGHKDLATTQIYANVHQDHLRGAISKLTSLISDNNTTPPRRLLATNANPTPPSEDHSK